MFDTSVMLDPILLEDEDLDGGVVPEEEDELFGDVGDDLGEDDAEEEEGSEDTE